MGQVPAVQPHAWKEYTGTYPDITHTCACGAAKGKRSYREKKPCTREADRRDARECEACYHVVVAGAMMTWYVCASCETEVLHHNTSTPSYCLPCSTKHSCCRRCGGAL